MPLTVEHQGQAPSMMSAPACADRDRSTGTGLASTAVEPDAVIRGRRRRTTPARSRGHDHEDGVDGIGTSARLR
jgi:hypothetical protein